MKIKILLNDEKKELYEKKLIEAGFIISEEATVFLVEEDFKTNYLIVKDEDNFYMKLNKDDIICFESFGHNIICEIMDKKYRAKEKLYQLESMFDQTEFIRISNSVIVNINYIEKIIPSIGMKFKLKLKNGKTVEVTRNYYYKFKETIGI
ncbi:LytTR family DNA-binding domain-containing protein [Haploplasma axanthum]|uniref:Sensory transduction protein lytR n=1 Tax=Haploplasma axanthum TaxID=29552 RepID=A0A449BE52_HAPAX|nr:LytTR family DNA-binding domain-containing protein [Haploplasma axanthum]VEU80729.1 Sensory transduction protein lytR [Haploplasma axanthum]